MWIGWRRDNTETPLSLKWCKTVKALGVHFRYDKEVRTSNAPDLSRVDSTKSRPVVPEVRARHSKRKWIHPCQNYLLQPFLLFVRPFPKEFLHNCLYQRNEFRGRWKDWKHVYQFWKERTFNNRYFAQQGFNTQILTTLLMCLSQTLAMKIYEIRRIILLSRAKIVENC